MKFSLKGYLIVHVTAHYLDCFSGCENVSETYRKGRKAIFDCNRFIVFE
jgi:hypothetical protein